MAKEIEIPEGYEARIEGSKVVFVPKESEDEMIRKSIVALIKEIKLQPLKRLEDWDGMLAYLEKQKEQPKEELVYRMNGLMQKYCEAGKDAQEKEHRLKCYQLFWDALEDADYFEQKEQKPAECNEEDAHDLSRFIEKRAKAYDFNLPNRGYDIFGFAKDILKHLKINHEKVLWSEEDEGMLNCIIATLCEESHGGREANDKMVTWLENRLKSLRPQPSWKPSEEQMEALARATNRCVGVEDAKKLLELLEQLKSL